MASPLSLCHTQTLNFPSALLKRRQINSEYTIHHIQSIRNARFGFENRVSHSHATRKIIFSDAGEQQIPPNLLLSIPKVRIPCRYGDPGCNLSPCASPAADLTYLFKIPARRSVAGARPLAVRMLFAQAHWGTARDYGATGKQLSEADFNLFFPQTVPTSLLFACFFFALPCFFGFSLPFFCVSLLFWLFLAAFLLFLAFFLLFLAFFACFSFAFPCFFGFFLLPFCFSFRFLLAFLLLFLAFFFFCAEACKWPSLPSQLGIWGEKHPFWAQRLVSCPNHFLGGGEYCWKRKASPG